MKKTFSTVQFTILNYFSVIMPNLIGGTFIFIYFWFLDLKRIIVLDITLPKQSMYITLLIIITAYVLIILLITRRVIKINPLLKRHRSGLLTEDEINFLKRYILNTNIYSITIVFIGWLFAGIVVPTYLYFVGRSLMLAFRTFFITTFVAGSLAVMITFYLTDSLLKRYIPRIFPDGDFSKVKGIWSIRISARMLIAFWLGGLLPVLIYHYNSNIYVQIVNLGLHNADVQYRYNAIVVIVISLSVIMTIITSVYFFRNIGKPLADVERAMKSVERGNLDISLKVNYKDEIGNVLHGMNTMVKGLKQAIRDREDLIVMDHEMNIAQEVQRSVLTDKSYYCAIEPLEIEVTYIPQNKKVGGDYYNITELDDGQCTIMIADATGHGVQAALTTMQIDILNKQSMYFKDPEKRLGYINNFYINMLKSHNLITSFIMNISGEDIRFASAGHPYQLLIRPKNRELLPLHTNGMIIGFLPDSEYESECIQLEPEDIILLFTDGVFEEFNSSEEEFGEKRFYDLIRLFLERDLHLGSLKEFNNAVMSRIDEFLSGHPYHDDVTLISIRQR